MLSGSFGEEDTSCPERVKVRPTSLWGRRLFSDEKQTQTSRLEAVGRVAALPHTCVSFTLASVTSGQSRTTLSMSHCRRTM